MEIREKALQQDVKNYIKARRVALGYKQCDIEELSGVKVRTLQKFEQTGEISLKNLCRLIVAYDMDFKIAPFFRDRSWWSLEQIKRAEKQKTVRSKKNEDTGIKIVPIDNAKFGNFTNNNTYKVIEVRQSEKESSYEIGRSFLVKDNRGDKVVLTENYCKKVIENE